MRHQRYVGPPHGSTEIVFGNKGYRLIVDADDAEAVGRFILVPTAFRDGRVYARVFGILNISYRTIYLHRHLLGAKAGEVVDHINGNTLDCRRANLRICTQAENIRNSRKRTSKTSALYKGVHVRGKRFLARVTLNHKAHYLGTFGTPEEAARAYDAAAMQLHGEFARLNFPEVTQ